MLQELAIRNFAIIDDVRIRLDNGFIVLSGETGAGKSIIINAVNLLLGARATARMVRTGAEEAELEALFQVPPESRIAECMTAQDLNPAEGLLIRRIISANDRHRVYINGRLSTLQLLTEITETLASISGQHAHQTLLKEEQHLAILDQFGELMPLRSRMETLYQQLALLVEERDDLRRQAARLSEEREFLEFQLQEIADVAPDPDEDSALEAERQRLRNAETLVQTVSGCVETLYSATGSASEQVGEAGKHLERLLRFDDALSPIREQLEDLRYRIDDAAESLRAYLGSQDLDPARLDTVEARLDLLNRLKRKHGGTLEVVLEKQKTLLASLDGLDSLDDRVRETNRQLDKMYQEAVGLARELSTRRKDAGKSLARRVEQELSTLKMPDTRFELAFETFPAVETPDNYLQIDGNALKSWGIDRVAFFISSNPGEALKPLAAIASGGELSRVVLALKSILAINDAVETVVFDEVDAGIGGGVAEMVGRKLSELANRHQVICITHLAQIAKFADHHFRIVKTVKSDHTATSITPLEPKQRIEEIARMLGGTRITSKTLEHAREMLTSS